MTLEQFKIDFPARLAAMTKDERIAGLEKAGFIFADQWLTDLFEASSTCFAEVDPLQLSANSSELALAA